MQDLLVALGVDKGAVTVAGTGSDGPYNVADTDTKGNLLPGPATRNRKVVAVLSPA